MLALPLFALRGGDGAWLRVHVMVRNEERALPRLLRSLEGAPVRSVVLCDTNSSDRTLEVARAWAAKTGIPLHVYHAHFTNFEETRNACLRLMGGEAEGWTALMDADFTLRAAPSLPLPEWDVNTIQIHPATPGHVHNALPLLVRSSALPACRYRLWTHEFLECPFAHGLYAPLAYADHADGASRPEKTARDIRLLSAWLRRGGEEELRPRALYYLGRAHEDAGNWSEAARLYTEHNAIQNLANYLFYARYRLALVEMKRRGERSEELLHAAIASYDGIFRREPFYYLARLYRMRGDFARCSIYGAAGLHAPPIDHARVPLFLEPLIYDWVLEEEYAYCLLQLGHAERARSHFERVLKSHSLDAVSRERVARYGAGV